MFWFTETADDGKRAEGNGVQPPVPSSKYAKSHSTEGNHRSGAAAPSPTATSAAANGKISEDVLRGALDEMHEELLLSRAQQNQLKQQIAGQKERAEQKELEMEEMRASFNKEREYFKAQMANSRRFIREIQGKTVAVSQKWQQMRDSMSDKITELAEIVEFQMLEITETNNQLTAAREELKVYKENARVSMGEEAEGGDAGVGAGAEEWQIMISKWVSEKMHLKKQIELLSSTAEERLLLLDAIVRACDHLRRGADEETSKDPDAAAAVAAAAQQQFFAADADARAYLSRYRAPPRAQSMLLPAAAAQLRARQALDSARLRLRTLQEPVAVPDLGVPRNSSTPDSNDAVPMRSPLTVQRPATPLNPAPPMRGDAVNTNSSVPHTETTPPEPTTKSAASAAAAVSAAPTTAPAVKSVMKESIPQESSFFGFWS